MSEILKSKSYKAFGWELIGKFSNQTIGFVITIILARLLNPSDFGLLAMVNVVIGFSGVFIDLGLSRGLIQKKNITEQHYGSVFFFNLFVGLLLTIVLFFSAPYVASYYNEPKLINIARVMSFSFLFSSFGNTLRMKLRKELDFKVINQSSIFASALSGALGVCLAYIGWGVWSLIVQSLSSIILANIYLFFREKWRPKMFFSFSALKDLWHISFLPFVLDITDCFYAQLDSLIIGKHFSSEKLGFYYRGKSLQTLVNSYLGNTVGTVTFPLLSKLNDNEIVFRSTVLKLFHMITFVSFFLLAILYMCAEDIVVILFTDKWIQSVEYFKIICLGGFTFPVGLVLINVLLSKGESKKYFQLGIMKKIFQFSPFVLLIYYGINEFLYGVVVASIINFSLNVYYASKSLNISILKFWNPFTIYTVIAVSCVFLITFISQFLNITSHWLHAIFSAIIFTVLFSGFTKLLNMQGFYLIKKEINSISNKWKCKRNI